MRTVSVKGLVCRAPGGMEAITEYAGLAFRKTMRGGPPGQRFPHKEPQLLDTPEALEAICAFRFNTDSWHTSFSFQEPLFIISPIFPSLRPAVLISPGPQGRRIWLLLESHQGYPWFRPELLLPCH